MKTTAQMQIYQTNSNGAARLIGTVRFPLDIPETEIYDRDSLLYDNTANLSMFGCHTRLMVVWTELLDCPDVYRAEGAASLPLETEEG